MIGFWYGTKLVWDENYTIGNIFTVSGKSSQFNIKN
jgi:hypothetical protein